MKIPFTQKTVHYQSNSYFKLSHYLFILYLIGFYLNIHLYITDTLFIPSYVSAFSGYLLLYLNRRYLNTSKLYYYIIYIILLLLSIISNYNDGYAFERFKGFLVLTFSFPPAVGFYLHIQQIPVQKRKKLFIFLTLILLFGSYIEVLVPQFRSIVEFISTLIHNDSINYISNEWSLNRDIIAHGGFARPSFFSSEPSNLAKSYVIFNALWFSSTQKKPNDLFKVLILLLLGFVAIRSPIIVLGAIICVILFIIYRKRSIKNILLNQIIFLFVILIFIFMYYVLKDRFTDIVLGYDTSANNRFIVPLFLVKSSFEYNFLFGIGVSGSEVLLNQYNLLHSYFQVKEHDIYTIGMVFPNSVFAHFAYLGAFGGVSSIYILNKFFKCFNNSNMKLFWLITFLVSLTLGGYVGVYFWTYIFLVKVISNTHISS